IPRPSKRRVDINTTATYRTGTSMSTWTWVSTTKIAHATIAIERILIVAGVKKGVLIFIDPPQCARLEENDVNNSVRRRCVEGAADKAQTCRHVCFVPSVDIRGAIRQRFLVVDLICSS